MSNHNDTDGDPLDFKLAKAIRELDREIDPERDLWPGIERRITNLPQSRRSEWMQRWMPVGVAASFVLALSALAVSIYRTSFEAPRQLTFEQSMTQMDAEYRRVRAPLVRQFEQEKRNLDPELAELVSRNLQIIDRAKAELEQALERDPDNPRLLEMLMRVNQQELDLLSRDLVAPGRSI